MASSSSSSPSAPAFSSRSWKHHVFLSFRGEDTRNTFVGHLYSALENMGIITYKDDKKLSLGEAISPSLIEAIEQSQIAIIVFSENYADSSWCLNELRHIMKCRKERGLIAVPIFYGVEPSEVRKQEKKYGEAFAKYESVKNINTVSWREALVEASGNSGQDFKTGNMDESELIKSIVNQIANMIHPLTPRVNNNLVGVEARMEDLMSKLRTGLDCVLMIGIWGFGGAGKTTLATSIYCKLSWEFDGCGFIENIRDQSSKNGLEALQGKLLSGVLKQENVLVGSIAEGKAMIMDRFSGKRVLIVLDDVDQHDQLEALAGSIDWFAKGSRIIITTRNEQLLKAHKVDVHNISLLDNDEATKLLSRCAGLDHKPMEHYKQVSKEVVTYASGLPLALTVLGSFLYDKDINEWKSTLARLKKIPEDDILGRLRISYDGLKKVEQDLFLDIACFFRGEYKDSAMQIFGACGLYPDVGLKVLREKALITIAYEKFDMHDLVQEMGHHIVRGKHANNPEKHSRIWKEEDVVTICSMDATTDLDTIEAIRYRYNIDHFSKMPNPLQDLPPIVANTKNLRWIDWEGSFSSPLLTNFPQRKLCYLKLSDILQEKLWEGYKFLPNLKIMQLLYLENLIMLPNFAGLQNLESFELHGSPNLKEIDSSFGLLEKLVCLSIEHCEGIKIFPSVNQLKNLKTISIEGSPGLFKLIQQKMDNVALDPDLDSRGDTHVNNRLKNLKTLLFRGHSRQFNHLNKVKTRVKKVRKDLIDLVECRLEEPSLPHNNMNHHTQFWFSHANLKKLDLSSCYLNDEDINHSEWEFPNLQELNLSGNWGLTRLDFSLWRLPRLKWLNLRSCYELVELSNLPSSIAVIDAENCWSLKWFGDTSNCKWLWKVSTQSGTELDPFHGERLLNSMLQGNAIEDHFINVTLENQIPKEFVGSFFGRKTFTSRHPHVSETFTLHLPDDWYNDFCGFLIRVVTGDFYMSSMKIIMKQEAEEDDSRFETWQEFDEVPEPECDGGCRTHVGYVSFSSLSQITSYNIISFSIESEWSSFAAELVPLKSKDDAVQTTKIATKSSEFRDEEDGYFTNSTGFTIVYISKANVNIYWVAR